MLVNLTSRKLAIAVAAALGVVAASSAVMAVTDTAFTYKTVQTGYLSIPSSSFSSDNFFNTYRNSDTSGVTGGSCGITGVQLPQGAVMKTITFWASSSTGTGPSVTLTRVVMTTGHSEEIIAQQNVDATGNRKTYNVTAFAGLSKVDNSKFWYALDACVDGTSKFYGARLTYTYANAGD